MLITMTDLIKGVTRIAGHQPSRLTKREFEIAISLGGKYTVTVHQTEEGNWGCTVTFEGKNDPHVIGTSRGNTKVWGNILGAILYVQNNFPYATNVFVMIGKWELVRINHGC